MSNKCIYFYLINEKQLKRSFCLNHRTLLINNLFIMNYSTDKFLCTSSLFLLFSLINLMFNWFFQNVYIHIIYCTYFLGVSILTYCFLQSFATNFACNISFPDLISSVSRPELKVFVLDRVSLLQFTHIWCELLFQHISLSNQGSKMILETNSLPQHAVNSCWTVMHCYYS